MSRKKLVFMYMEDTDGFNAQGLNFSTEEIMHVNRGSGGELELVLDSMEGKIPENFWGECISDIHMLVGGNGAGKTTVMRTICQWVCELSENSIPQERGILVFKEDDIFRYAAFEDGKEIILKKKGFDSSIISVNDAKYFNDLKLIYFTNTMAELGVDNYEILLDFSKSKRIKEANSNGFFSDDIIANFERYEFDKQISMALTMQDFPIRYISLEFKEICWEDFAVYLGIYKTDIIKDIDQLWKSYFPDPNNESFSISEKMIIRFLNTLFHDMIKKLLKWGNEFAPNLKGEVEKALYDIIGVERVYNAGIYEGIRWISQFLGDLLNECKKKCINNANRDVFQKYWGNTCRYIVNFFRTLLSEQNFQWINQFLKMWEPVPARTKGQKYAYKMKLKGNEDAFEKFWRVYRKIVLYMENITFGWNTSSGQRSKADLLPVLQSLPNGVQNIWFLLDEPDNTFHPEGERGLIKLIIQILNQNKESHKQLWISTHSPIMLSDMPGASVIYLKEDEITNEKKVIYEDNETFGQNIYYLYNNAFFLENGIIGEYASQKITEIVIELHNTEKELMLSSEYNEKIKQRINRCEKMSKLIAEPTYAKHIQYALERCNRLAKREKGNDKNTSDR